MTLDDIKASMKAANCAADRLANGDGCECTLFGRGAGLGWDVTVICHGEELKWIIPPRDARDGVGFGRDFTCDTVRRDVRDMLELLDRERAKEMPVEPQSWQWPSSFFTNEDGIPLHDTPEGRSEEWIQKYCDKVQVAPEDLRAGDIVWFEGNRPGSSGENISHTAIATGRGDEISHMWWTREIQDHMVSDPMLKPRESDPGQAQGGYTVTRDSLADIQWRFTYSGSPPPPPSPIPVPTPPMPTPTPPPGERVPPAAASNYYLTNEYTVWRFRDGRRANFDEFFGCP